MAKEERTPWFPGSVKPVHKGWYEIDGYGLAGTKWGFWDGRLWRWSRGSEMLFQIGFYPEDRWRGLTKPAN